MDPVYVDALKNYAPPVAWVVAGIGWIIGNQQANTRERRKEVRSEIADICELLKTILASGQTYQTYRDEADRETKVALALEIKFALQEVDVRIERLHKRDLDAFPIGGTDVIENAQNAFFDDMTGEFFESADIPEKVDLIRLRANQHRSQLRLTEALHGQFMLQFR